jgi:hypothetical protein
MTANDRNRFSGSWLALGPPSNVLGALFHEHVLDLKIAEISFEPELSTDRIMYCGPFAAS